MSIQLFFFLCTIPNLYNCSKNWKHVFAVQKFSSDAYQSMKLWIIAKQVIGPWFRICICLAIQALLVVWLLSGIFPLFRAILLFCCTENRRVFNFLIPHLPSHVQLLFLRLLSWVYLEQNQRYVMLQSLSKAFYNVTIFTAFLGLHCFLLLSQMCKRLPFVHC